MCTTLWVWTTKTGQGFGDKSCFRSFLYNQAFYNQLSSSLNPVYLAFIPLVIINLIAWNIMIFFTYPQKFFSLYITTSLKTLNNKIFIYLSKNFFFVVTRTIFLDKFLYRRKMKPETSSVYKNLLINPCTSFVQKRESLYNVAPFDQ